MDDPALPNVPFKVKAVYSWSGDVSTDLGFIEGDIIEVVKVKGSWFYGRLLRNKKSGAFPANYVNVIQEEYNTFSVTSKPKPAKQKLKPMNSSVPPVPDRHERRSPKKKSPTPPPPMITPSSSSRTLYQQGSTPTRSPANTPTKGSLTPSKAVLTRTSPGKSSAKSSQTMLASSPLSQQGHKVSANKYPSDEEMLRRYYEKIGQERIQDLKKLDILESKKMKKQLPDLPPLPPLPRLEPKSVSESSLPLTQTAFLRDSQTSEESYSLMSDFSATSAGSFYRHKHSSNFVDSLESHESSKLGGMFKRFLGKESPSLPDLTKLKVSGTTSDWIEVNSALNRANTLSSKELRERVKRVLENEPEIITEPHKFLTDVNKNEGIQNTFMVVDDYIDSQVRTLNHAKYTSCESFAQNALRFDGNPISQLRAMYVWCCEKYQLIDDKSTDFGKEPVVTFHKNYCTPFQLTWLFKKMANALSIECEVVVGFLKTGVTEDNEFKFNHCWLRVSVNGEWRFVDVILGNITNPIHEFIEKPIAMCEDFYFLTEPTSMIYTHVPYFYQEQHIQPPLDKNIALALPAVFPAFFENDLKLAKFNNALSRLQDNDVYQISLQVPPDVEIYASCDDSAVSTLCQVYTHPKRIVVVKAVVPNPNSKATLHIYSGSAKKHPLALAIPLQHTGSSKPFEFVKRVPHDLYIKKPQQRFLSRHNDYTFSVICDHPVTIASPSGKTHDMRRSDVTWELSLKVTEPGLWKVVTQNVCVAEWECN